VNVSDRVARIGLQLESRPEDVALVRSALAALADAAAIDQSLLMDLKTAVSEACNNIVLHAYEDVLGQMLVTIELRPDSIDVNVRDHGSGIRRIAAGEDRMGLGLAVMTALASRTEFSSPPDGGTEVRMSFDRCPASDGSHPLSVPQATELPYDPVETLGGNVVVHVSPASLVGPVLGRLARATAANAGFSVARFHDLYPVADALANHAKRAANGSVSFAIQASRRNLDLVVGPFNHLPDGAEGFVGLVDAVSFETDDDHELLHLTLIDDARTPPAD
jgi:anti-sigma regulatory factor (Ser/Thr protein kinase)